MDVYKLWTCDDNSESQLSSTSSEIEKEIDVLRKTFDFVRLLKADGPHGVSGCVENPCQCFSFWKVNAFSMMNPIPTRFAPDCLIKSMTPKAAFP